MLFGTQRINDRGHLEVAGIDTVDLAARFGTPLYVIDEEALRARCREYLTCFRKEAPDVQVAFATKAFLCRAAAALAHEEGLDLDVASIGELRVVLAAGVDPAHITFHGNYKKDEELEQALRAGVGLIAIDSVDEMHALSRIASTLGLRQRAVIRVAPGIDGHTLDAISTGRNDTKFGITVEDGAALRAIEECRRLPGLELIGLHAHVGSQILTLEPFELLAEKMCALAREAGARSGWTPEMLVLGGGLGIRYEEGQAPPSIAELAQTLVGGVRRAAAVHGLKMPRIAIEPGRSLVGEFGLTLYRIGPIKEVPGSDVPRRTYVSVDGGLSDNPRPLMYGATYPVLLADRAAEPASKAVRVAGRHCETDTLFDVTLPPPRSGNLLAVLSTGAYNHTMASNYNFFCRPAVVFVRRGDARLVVRRETEDDLLRRDVV
jgi:diaminopimelate decarboxylase